MSLWVTLGKFRLDHGPIQHFHMEVRICIKGRKKLFPKKEEMLSETSLPHLCHRTSGIQLKRNTADTKDLDLREMQISHVGILFSTPQDFNCYIFIIKVTKNICVHT